MFGRLGAVPDVWGASWGYLRAEPTPEDQQRYSKTREQNRRKKAEADPAYAERRRQQQRKAYEQWKKRQKTSTRSTRCSRAR